ncbi:hypothetical protein HMPREF9372_2974 [Sporosarcina newyorkensis 2681]|uniref:Uncharacterized protein n=1 Tax=Sporosarcina newyorkensis 2681 TaxID=1027292 RepID=F9DVZ3_9BACL|nr:hypothetical protein HMPREF9372_2974 [Sporosarcina newyorkensis 2681]
MIYMAILSIWAFAAMGFDKKQAQKKKSVFQKGIFGYSHY